MQKLWADKNDMKDRSDTVQQNKGDTPRVMIAAAGSGSGKTLITCALLEALRRRDLRLRAFKCGPDYIDPMFHRRVLGVESSNLDSYFMDRYFIRHNVKRYSDRYTVIEGVMGIYDGRDVSDIKGSCYEIAAITDTPVILIVDASGVGRTVISQIKGILADDRYGLIKGIILNRISEGFYDRLKPVLRDELRSDKCEDIKILGGIPGTEGVGIESRHLGLKLPNEIEDIKERIGRFADVLEDKCDIEGILKIMDDAPEITPTRGWNKEFEQHSDNAKGPVIAVARDEAFCFYYEESINAIIKAGGRAEYFSPIHDKSLPEGTAGILLGGGYPELYLEELSANTDMLTSIREAIESGMPSIAECGGFMYLHRQIKDKEGRKYGLIGAIDGECSYSGHSVRFGYMQIDGDKSRDPQAFGVTLTGIKGHEFHYYDSTCNGEDCTAYKPSTGRTWECMMTGNDRLWGFPHLYYPSCKGFAKGFIEAAKRYRNG